MFFVGNSGSMFEWMCLDHLFWRRKTAKCCRVKTNAFLCLFLFFEKIQLSGGEICSPCVKCSCINLPFLFFPGGVSRCLLHQRGSMSACVRARRAGTKLDATVPPPPPIPRLPRPFCSLCLIDSLTKQAKEDESPPSAAEILHALDAARSTDPDLHASIQRGQYCM